MTDEDNKKGFSGLSDLVSDIDHIDTVAEQKTSNVTKPSDIELPSSKPPKSSQKEPKKEPKKEQTNATSGQSNLKTKQDTNTGKKWFLGIAAVILVIWFVNNADKSPKTALPTSQEPSNVYNKLDNNQTQVDQRSVDGSTKGLSYEKPPIGTNNRLWTSQLRWCLRENIRIETMRGQIKTNKGIDEFNKIVDGYNSRCGSYQYKKSSLNRAQKDVDANKSQIVSEAISYARKLDGSSVLSDPSIASKDTGKNPPKRPDKHLTIEVQQLLTDLGYNPGSIDGLYGRRTATAIKKFQSYSKITQDGAISRELLELLKKSKPIIGQYKKETPRQVVNKKDNDVSDERMSSSINHTEYFTRGSYKNNVLQIQGKPDAINHYSSLGYYELKYGYSSIKISNHDHRVLSWSNQGNLRVQLLPGQHVTNANHFTRGSHQDDILRIQGTPEDIIDYSSLGYEEWKYGYSSIKISIRNRRVMTWSNNGNLKVKLLPGKHTTNFTFITRGSHQDDILRIQGTPEDIIDYSSLGYEEWKYGYSSFKIGITSHKVMSWTNQGNLKVYLSPGPNTTNSSYFSVNSHQDDVLRLQGTPDDIINYSSLGYEEWKYGYSSVKISLQNQLVLELSNSSGNLKSR